jgi:cysteine/O-acetylserine efflux protein
MPTYLVAAVPYILITTFTPGPSNISSASMGVRYGFKSTLTYLFGLAAGFFLVMILSGWISSTILESFPVLEPLFRYLGAAYILYLAFSILKESYTFKEVHPKPMGFGHGILLQIVNPKLIVYAITLFSGLLAPFIESTPRLLSAVVLLTVTSFCATAVWALFGTAIKSYLHSARIKAALNIVLSLLLVLTAVQLAGFL